VRSEKNILIAFLLNLFFSVFEFAGGAFTGSVAIMSDAVHDLGDALSIGISWGLEKKSKKQPDETYTYGYARYSVMGSVITTAVLLAGSVIVIYHSIRRIIAPSEINYNGMIAIGIFGVVVNCAAAFFTREGDSLNQKAVNLHMLEDVLGWVVVLAGALIMRFTDISVIDPLMSVAVAVFILIGALKNLRESLNIFLEKIPEGMDVAELREHLLSLDGVEDVHHIHLWTMDGLSHYATLHVVSEAEPQILRTSIRRELAEHGIGHVTVEIELPGEVCPEENCHVENHEAQGHHHHHHHG